MAKSREDLNKYLINYLEIDHIYFQPPESIRLNYPAVVYKLSDIRNLTANNSVYKQEKAYDLTIIDEDPDSDLVRKVSLLPVKYLNRFTSDGLYHTIFRLYY